MTHDELCVHAARWLRTKRRMRIVLRDVRVTVVSEQPDAIGFSSSRSVLVECKTSIQDLRRDAQKIFRRDPARGMGKERWVMMPRALESAAEHVLPDWGILLVDERRLSINIVRRSRFFERNVDAENVLLISALQRATEGWGRRMFLVDGDPHPTASKLLAELREENTRLRHELQALRAPSSKP